MLSAVLLCALMQTLPPSPTVCAQAARTLESGLPAARKDLPQLLPLAKSCADLLGPGSRNARKLQAGLLSLEALPATERETALRVLAKELEELAVDLAFQPVNESPLPQGFPAHTPVGEIAIREYPAYRLARTAMNRTRNSAFWRLFNHIQSHSIPMTAPVEITYERERPQAMAFLYQATAGGTLGPEGEVEVVDVPAAKVISIGLRGSTDEKRLANAREELQRWIAGQARYEICGPARSMSWNSPMVADKRRYCEVQYPVRLRADWAPRPIQPGSASNG